mmetsp:Transcript_6805/g.17037  ORF Transcript_6805/g.17037 Transcript_6805/m.17037 type:complete len:801 (+) Transcript_6805:31-2433(+)
MLSISSMGSSAPRSGDNGSLCHFNDDVFENEIRCNRILECKRMIDYWKSELKHLEKEQTTKIKLARIRIDPVINWRSLSSRDRMDKKFILAAMESDADLPAHLDDFPNSGNLPPSIRMDRDILLARVARPDFQAKYEDERLYVPPGMRGDKAVILAIIPKHCAVVECISATLRDDPEIFEAVLTSKSRLPAYVLQHFSDAIRSDENLMLRLCAHPHGISSMTFVSPNLRNNKTFLKKAIRAIGGSRARGNSSANGDDSKKGGDTSCLSEVHLVLRYATQRLQDDAEVVLQAVKQCGMNLKYASYTLRRDYTIARAAVEENGAAFRYCLPGNAKDRLLTDRDLVLHRILQTTETPNPTTLKQCMDRFPDDQEILLEVYGHGAVDWESLRPRIRDEREFARRAVARNPEWCYFNIPEDLKKDFRIASALIHRDGQFGIDGVLPDEACFCCPELFADRETMLTIATRRRPTTTTSTLASDDDELLQWIFALCPPHIPRDKEIMLELIRTNASAYDFCDESLSMDVDILLATVGSCPSYLHLVPAAVQLANPSIVVRAIESCDPENAWSLTDDVCEELWSNRDVAIAWLSRFGHWLHGSFPEEWEGDEEICLALVRKDWAEFESCSEALLRNKEFMLRAVAIDARVVEYLEYYDGNVDSDSDDDSDSDFDDDDDEPGGLRYDDDLTVLAFANDKRAIQSYSGGEDFEYMVSLTKRLRKRIRDYRAFEEVIVAAVVKPQAGQSSSSSFSSSFSFSSSQCCLPLLNQGPDTVQQHSQLIASYLGLPDRDEFERLCRASANLLHWGF